MSLVLPAVIWKGMVFGVLSLESVRVNTPVVDNAGGITANVDVKLCTLSLGLATCVHLKFVGVCLGLATAVHLEFGVTGVGLVNWVHLKLGGVYWGLEVGGGEGVLTPSCTSRSETINAGIVAGRLYG